MSNSPVTANVSAPEHSQQSDESQHHHHHYYYYSLPQGAPPPSVPFPPERGEAVAGPGGLDPLGPPGSQGARLHGPQASHDVTHSHTDESVPHLHRGENFVKGLLIGAGVSFLLSNETVQKSMIKSAVVLWGALQGGVEEVKERFRDAEAEIKAGSNGSA